MRYLILALLLVGLSGCASSQRQLAQFYRTGMTRSEVRASFPERPEPFVSAVRPASGWQNARPDQFRRGFIYPQIGMEALAFERSHATSVSACDVYLHSRGILGMGGFDMDYLFYNDNNQLIGFRRNLLSP